MTDTLTPEVQKQYNDYFDMFSSDGWKLFITDMQESLEINQKTAISRCDTEQKWFEERGMQAHMMRILSFEKALRAQYDKLTNPDPYEDENPLEVY